MLLQVKTGAARVFPKPEVGVRGEGSVKNMSRNTVFSVL